jgi:hypothetical protein
MVIKLRARFSNSGLHCYGEGIYGSRMPKKGGNQAIEMRQHRIDEVGLNRLGSLAKDI